MSPRPLIILCVLLFFATLSSQQNVDSVVRTSDAPAGFHWEVAQKGSPESTRNDTVVVHRCKADEFSSGAALAVMIVLATASVLQMPGSLLSRKSSLYRISPELSLLEIIPLILLVGDAYFIRKRSLKMAVKAAFVARFQRQNDDDPQTRRFHENDQSNDEGPGIDRRLDQFLRQLQTFGLSRMLSDALVSLAFTKAVAVKGTVRTVVLAVSYALPFFTIELLSLAALRFNPRPQSRAQFQAEKVDIRNLIRSIEINRKSDYDLDPNGPSSFRYFSLAFVTFAIYGGLAAMHLFWPFSVPAFLLFDFEEKHSASGKWVFLYSTWLMWVFWVAFGALGVAVLVGMPILALWRVPRVRDRCIKFLEARGRMNINADRYTVYAILKFAMIVRFYGWQYTGQNTVKPDWLDWLG